MQKMLDWVYPHNMTRKEADLEETIFQNDMDQSPGSTAINGVR